VFSPWSGKPHFAQQRVAPRGVPRVRATQLAERDVADVQTDVRVMAHDKGVPGKVVAQLMGHINADITINVYTQVLDASLRAAVDRLGGELFAIVHKPETASGLSRCSS
jgi:integrase